MSATLFPRGVPRGSVDRARPLQWDQVPVSHSATLTVPGAPLDGQDHSTGESGEDFALPPTEVTRPPGREGGRKRFLGSIEESGSDSGSGTQPLNKRSKPLHEAESLAHVVPAAHTRAEVVERGVATLEEDEDEEVVGIEIDGNASPDEGEGDDEVEE